MALAAAERKPTKRLIKKARAKILRVPARMPEPAIAASVTGSAGVLADYDPAEVARALEQMKFILAAVDEFRARDKREQEALIALLMAL